MFVCFRGPKHGWFCTFLLINSNFIVYKTTQNKAKRHAHRMIRQHALHQCTSTHQNCWAEVLLLYSPYFMPVLCIQTSTRYIDQHILYENLTGVCTPRILTPVYSSTLLLSYPKSEVRENNSRLGLRRGGLGLERGRLGLERGGLGLRSERGGLALDRERLGLEHGGLRPCCART